MPNNIALIGCGAIARSFYLPEIAKRRHQFNKVWILDPDDQARQIASSIVEARQGVTLADISDELQFAIVASPNVHHFCAAYEALSLNAHVLVEKPLVIWPHDGRELIKLAGARRRILAVNQTRRLFPYTAELRRRIATGELGRLKAIVHSEGVKLGWPFSSGASFARGAQRTGVIMDVGVHVLDFYHYMLEPIWTYESAIHDGFRGPEGLAHLRLKANDAPVSVRLSRYQKQDNIARLYFEKAEVHINVHDANSYYIKMTSDAVPRRIVVKSGVVDFTFLAHRILTNFIGASEGLETCVCTAASSLPVIEILDEIYKRAKRYPEAKGTV